MPSLLQNKAKEKTLKINSEPFIGIQLHKTKKLSLITCSFKRSSLGDKEPLLQAKLNQNRK